MRAVPRVPGVRFEVCSPDLEFDFYDSVAEWAAALNAALRRGLADHAARPEWDAARTTRGGEALAAFQNRCAVAGRSVVSNAYSSGGAWPNAAVQAESNAKAARAEKDPLQWEGVLSDPRDMLGGRVAARVGIRRVCVGHKPSGDSPAVLSSDYTGVEIISADTSYSDPAAGSTADGDAPRGCAVACVTLRGASAEVNHAEISGVLKDGRRHAVALRTLNAAIGDDGDRHCDGHDGDPHVGLELDGEWWVKARIVDARRRADLLVLPGQGAGSRVQGSNVLSVLDAQAAFAQSTSGTIRPRSSTRSTSMLHSSWSSCISCMRSSGAVSFTAT